MTTQVRTCPFCGREIAETSVPRAACDEHLLDFMKATREKFKPISFNSAYYQQKRRYERPVSTKGETVLCKYCKEPFQRLGNEVFHPGSSCQRMWEQENQMSKDYSVVTKEQLETLYYDEDLSLANIATWYQKNMNLSISFDTVRKIMLKYGITWEEKLKRSNEKEQ